jgi:hypothetical protein
MSCVMPSSILALIPSGGCIVKVSNTVWLRPAEPAQACLLGRPAAASLDVLFAGSFCDRDHWLRQLQQPWLSEAQGFGLWNVFECVFHISLARMREYPAWEGLNACVSRFRTFWQKEEWARSG